jgi:NADH dehydrogenase
MPDAPVSPNEPLEVKPDPLRKVAIVGEIPFCGSALTQVAVEEGLVARVLCPDAGADAALKKLPAGLQENIEIVRGDLGSLEMILEALKGTYGVCFVSPITLSGRVYRARQHVDDVRRVIQGAESSALRKLVYHSSVGANPGANSRALQDAGTAEELITKSRCEDFRIRTGPLMGSGDGFLTDILRVAQSSKPFMTMMGYGGTLVQPLHVRDFGRCLVRVFSDKEPLPHGIYALGGPEIRSILELTDTALELLHRGKLKLHAPLFVLRILASMSKNAQFKEQVGMLFDPLAVEQNDAKKLLEDFRSLIKPAQVEQEMLAELIQ